MNYSSTVTIRVDNASSIDLFARRAWIKEGEAVTRMIDVMAGETCEFVVGRSRSGNHGTVAYDLGSLDQRLLVMWTSGINYDKFANILAVGVTPDLNTDKFSAMYFERHPWFVRQNFYYYRDPISARFGSLKITATMKIHPQAEVTVELQDVT